MRQKDEDESKKKKIITLKSIMNKEKESNESREKDNDEMAMVSRRFKKMIRRKKPNFKKKPYKKKASKDKEKEKEKEQSICFKCKKSANFKINYSQLKKVKKYKKKILMTTWSEVLSSGKERTQEIANLYLMAHRSKNIF